MLLGYGEYSNIELERVKKTDDHRRKPGNGLKPGRVMGQRVDTYLASMGQGYITASPLQVLVLLSQLPIMYSYKTNDYSGKFWINGKCCSAFYSRILWDITKDSKNYGL